jgi:hypothetical protein
MARPVNWPVEPAGAGVMPQPLGVVGTIAPRNDPVFLSMPPLAAHCPLMLVNNFDFVVDVQHICHLDLESGTRFSM